MGYFELIIACIFVNNILLAQFLGQCPFMGTSKKMETAIGMAMAVIFVLVMAGTITWIIYTYILVSYDLVYLRTIAFIVVIASLVQLVEMIIQYVSPSLYQALGVYLPLITTNCAVLGIAVINMQNEYSLFKSIVSGLGTAIGFTLAIVLMAGIRERIDYNPIPKAFQGYPIVLITAGLMAIAFLGFTGLI